MVAEGRIEVEKIGLLQRHFSSSGATLALASGLMPSIQVKDVPEAVHAELRRRAAIAGMSLQEYLLAHLVEEASQPPVDELLDQVGQRSGGHVSFRFAEAAVRSERDTR